MCNVHGMQIFYTFHYLSKKFFCIVFCVTTMRLLCNWVQYFNSFNILHNLVYLSSRFIFEELMRFHYIFMIKTASYCIFFFMGLSFFLIILSCYFYCIRGFFINIWYFKTFIYLGMSTFSKFLWKYIQTIETVNWLLIVFLL
jgi:hypothetical protein